jgi:hypothetical protein
MRVLRTVADSRSDYADAVAGNVGAVLFAGCVAGVEGEGKDVETECCAKGLTVEWSGGLMGRDGKPGGCAASEIG